MSRGVRLFLILLGLCITFLGHNIAQQSEWLVRIVASEYARTSRAYQTMLSEGIELRRGDPGFAGLVRVLSMHGSGSFEHIESLMAEPGEEIAIMGGYHAARIILRVRFDNGQVQSFDLPDLQSTIRDALRQKPLFKLGNAIFYIGLVISVVVALLPTQGGANLTK